VKTLKPRSNGRPNPEDALAIARSAAPAQPPAVIAPAGRPTTLNVRIQSDTLAGITTRARDHGLTIKQVICGALANAGVNVNPLDLEDRTPRRRDAA
jgi:hypothetical protein